MTGHRRPSIEDREPAIDLFDDPPWPSHRDTESTSRLRRLGFVVFVVVLGLLGLVGLLGVIAIITLVGTLFAGLWSGLNLNFNIGPIDVPPPSSYAIDLALSADGSVAYVTEPNTDKLLVLDTATGKVVNSVTVGSDPSGLAVTPNGSQVWVVNSTLSPAATGSTAGGLFSPVSGSGSVTVVSTASDLVLGTINVGTGPIDVAFSPDGRFAFVTDNGALSPGAVTVINTATLAVVWSLTPTAATGTASAPAAGAAAAGLPTGVNGPNPTSVAVTPNGRQVWVSVVDDLADGSQSPTTQDSVSVFDAATGAEAATIAVGAGPFFLVLSHDGRHAFVADKLSCDVKEIDTTTFDVVGTVRWPSSEGCPFGLAAGADDNVVYTVTGSDHSFDEAHAGRAFGSVDFATSETHVYGDVGSDPVTLTLSPDGETAYVVDADRPLIDVVDTANGAVRETFRIPD
jgi:YVTN family beta-propeller protein